jgi:hypothetical protein
VRFPRAWDGRVHATASVLLYGLLAVLVFWSAWRAPALMSIGFGPDPRLFVWDLGWTPFAASHGHNPLVTNYLDYPDGMNLLWSNSGPLVTTLLWPLTAVRGVIVAYNTALTAGVTLSAWSAFLVLRRFVRHPIAAFLGGLVYGFSPFVLAHALSQPHLVLVVLPPVIFLILHEILVRQRRPAILLGGLLGVVASAQLLVSEEILASMVFTSILAVALLAALYPNQVRPRAGYAAVALATAAATSLVLCALPLAVQFFGPQHVGRALNPTGFYVSDLAGFVIPGPLHWLAPAFAQTVSARFTGNIAEWHAYLGLPLLAVIVYTARRLWHTGLVKVVSLLALMVALLSLGPTVHVAGVTTLIPVAAFAAVFLLVRKTAPAPPIMLTFVSAWAALAILPVFSNAYPGRLMVYVFLLAGLLFAMFVDLVLASPMRPRAWAVAASVAVIVTLAPTLPFPATPMQVPDFFTSTVRDRVPEGSVALVAPYAYAWDDRAMVWQSAAGMWFRMPEGYGTVPGPTVNPPATALGSLMMDIGQGLPYDGLSDPVRDRLHGDLARWSVRTVVIGPMEHEANMVSLFRDLLQREPEITGGVYVWANLTESSTRSTS